MPEHSIEEPEANGAAGRARQGPHPGQNGVSLVGRARGAMAAGDAEVLVRFLYDTLLGRTPEPAALAFHVAHLLDGHPVGAVIGAIADSEEARRRRAAPPAEDPIDTADAEFLIGFLYETLLGRPAEPAGLAAHLASLRHSRSIRQLVRSIADSEEARMRQVAPPARGDLLDVADAEFLVGFLYQTLLGRPVEPAGLAAHLRQFRHGRSVRQMVGAIADSQEARLRRTSRELCPQLSDGAFVMAISDMLLPDGITPRTLEALKAFLGESFERRTELVERLVTEHVRHAGTRAASALDPNTALVLGTERLVSRSEWNRRVAALGIDPARARPPASLAGRRFRHTGRYEVSAIASLHRGGRFIEAFLENITAQSTFDRSELIIVDAASPDGEAAVIERYRAVYDNIVYVRTDDRIGIYDAWNRAIGLARGRYVTNTNVDDLRRADSFELQARALDEHPAADVVYQDFFYSFDSRLSFDEVAAVGVCSRLPIVTSHNLLEHNFPHNAPMWRRSLHDELGLFDTRYRSAGDADFWLRCRRAGKAFHKLNTPHVVYFSNPEGISTRPDSLGPSESREILRRHGPALTSPYLLMSRTAFAEALGVDVEQTEAGQSCYALAHQALVALGRRRFAAEGAAASTAGAEPA
jgi:GT2 family glycosyltransferase